MPYCRYSSYFLVLGILVVLPYGPYLVRPYSHRLGRAVGRVSRSRLSTSSRPLLPGTILLSATESTCSSMAWGKHCFRGGWVSQFFRSSKSGSVVARDLSAKSHWLVLCRFHSPETTKTSQATPSVSFARFVLWVFMQLEIW